MLAHKIIGTGAALVVCQLQAGQAVCCEPGRFRWKTPNVAVEARLFSSANGVAGGLPSAAEIVTRALDVGKRLFAGGSLTWEQYSVIDGSGLVGFAGPAPGEMRTLELDGTASWYVEPDAVVAAEVGLDVDIALPTPGALRGAGRVLAKFSGTGTLVFSGFGSLYELNPAQVGGTIHCVPGSVVAFPEQIRYRVEPVAVVNGQSSWASLLSAEHRWVANLTGEGTVWMSSGGYAMSPTAPSQAAGVGRGTEEPLGGFLTGHHD